MRLRRFTRRFGSSGLILSCLATLASAQTRSAAKPFKATARLGVPYVIGAESTVIGSKEKIEVSSEREVTLQAAELSLSFLNRQENVFARAGEKLLIQAGSVRNPETTSDARLTSSNSFALRLWQAYKGPGKFKFVGTFDPSTLEYINKQLKPGDAAKFVAVGPLPSRSDTARSPRALRLTLPETGRTVEAAFNP